MEANDRPEVESDLTTAILVLWKLLEGVPLSNSIGLAKFNAGFEEHIQPIIERVYASGRYGLIQYAQDQGRLSKYGYCPRCSAKGVYRSRGIGELATTTCANGHTYQTKLFTPVPSVATFQKAFNDTEIGLDESEEVEVGKKKLSLWGRAVFGMSMFVSNFKRELWGIFQKRKQDHAQEVRDTPANEVVPKPMDRNRAERIAITTVTQTHSKAEIDQVEEFKELGIGKMVGVWNTADRPCKICAPWDGRTDWQETFPNGSPVHPRCACHVDWHFELEP